MEEEVCKYKIEMFIGGRVDGSKGNAGYSDVLKIFCQDYKIIAILLDISFKNISNIGIYEQILRRF